MTANRGKESVLEGRNLGNDGKQEESKHDGKPSILRSNHVLLGRLGVVDGAADGYFLTDGEGRFADSPVRKTPEAGFGPAAAFFFGAPLTIHCRHTTVTSSTNKVHR